MRDPNDLRDQVDPAQDNLWIRRFHQEAGDLTLVCFPHAGGSASFYYPVSEALRSTVQVVALQYPGRQDRRHERPLTTIAELADESFAALRPLMDRPLAFFGHSMGATLAFEVAVRMRRELGTAPVALFASGRRAPSRHRVETAHLLGDDGLVAELQSLSGTDARILGDLELLRMILPAIRSDYTAAETYRYEPGPALDCPIVALTGESDPKASLEEVGAWAEHTTGGFALHTFEGGHFYLARHQRAVLDVIRDRLRAGAM
ncbi:thioesterase II family protein [Kitasatospora sp. NPDC057500]|uniref:thioesterase II family protein n=1 Tax=Kitasatospora sp. NPDC057500 TaxID=3346151 RepID=UPI003681D915